ncbi:MAG TPA: hypothetical protein VGY56_21745 [Verrucomicrobiae bacterium]|nr:hypothetical protein [Verrucomicrobiae bacterium]
MKNQPEFTDKPPVIPSAAPTALIPGKKPFAFRAAKFSFLGFFFACGLVFIVAAVNEIINGFHPSAVALEITLWITIFIFTLFTMYGFILGIISLFGIRRYGTKGILGYAIAGIALNGTPWIWITINSLVFAVKHTQFGQ